MDMYEVKNKGGTPATFASALIAMRNGATYEQLYKDCQENPRSPTSPTSEDDEDETEWEEDPPLKRLRITYSAGLAESQSTPTKSSPKDHMVIGDSPKKPDTPLHKKVSRSIDMSKVIENIPQVPVPKIPVVIEDSVPKTVQTDPQTVTVIMKKPQNSETAMQEVCIEMAVKRLLAEIHMMKHFGSAMDAIQMLEKANRSLCRVRDSS